MARAVRFTVLPTDEYTERPRAKGASQSHWARIGDLTVTWSDDSKAPAGRFVGRAGGLGLVTQVGSAFTTEHPTVRVIVERGRHLVIDLASWTDAVPADDHDWRVETLTADTVVVDTPKLRATSARRGVTDVVDALDPQRVTADLEHLVGLGTRHSLSAGFVAAADWVQQRLEDLGFSVTRPGVPVGSGQSANVIGDRRGTAAEPRRVVVITAHLDSVNLAGGPSAAAPGADDNASGSVGALELARVMSGMSYANDLRVILFGGEEQGLFGSRRYVAALPADERSRIKAVLNMDMIGTLSGLPSVLLEGAALSQGIIDDLAAAAASYTTLRVTTSLNPFASDHVPFIDAGIPAVLTIEGNDSANTHIHTADDTLAHVTVEYLTQILRMNAAAVANWLGLAAARPQPAGPVIAWSSGRG